MEYLVNKLKSFGIIEGDKVIEGYVLMNDEKNAKSYVMVKQDNKYWKTEWISNSAISVKNPDKSLNDVVNNV